MRRTIATLLAGALLCPVVAPTFAQEQDRPASGTPAAGEDQNRAGSEQARDAAAAGEDRAQAAAGRDQAEQDPVKSFVKEAYNTNLYEVQAGQLAGQKAQDDEIKQFARTMVEDHQKANQQLKQVAQSKQIQLDEQLDEVHKAKLAKLQKCSAQDLGRKYINGQAAGHMMTVLEFRYQSQNLQDPQLKQWATTMLPKLEQHLDHATKIATRQAGGAEARPAGER